MENTQNIPTVASVAPTTKLVEKNFGFDFSPLRSANVDPKEYSLRTRLEKPTNETDGEDSDAMEKEVEEVEYETCKRQKMCDEWTHGQNAVEWVLPKVTVDGKDLKMFSNEPNSREVMVTLIKTVLAPAVEKLKLELPQNFEGISQKGMSDFLKEFKAAAEEFEKKNPATSLMSKKGWQKPKSRCLQTIVELAGRIAIPNPKKLNSGYATGSSATYGETTLPQMQAILNDLKLGEDDVFVDLGSGIGQLVMFVASFVNVKMAIGIEQAPVPSGFAPKYSRQFERFLEYFGIEPSPYQLMEGSFLTKHRELAKTGKVFFVNNLLFDANLTQGTKTLLEDCDEGIRAVVTAPLSDLRPRERNATSDFASVSIVRDLPTLAGGVSWTNKKIKFQCIEKRITKLVERCEREEKDKKLPRTRKGR